MKNDNPFISTATKQAAQQAERPAIITKEELVSDFEKLKEPFSKVPPMPQRAFTITGRGDNGFHIAWQKALRGEIQNVTDSLEKIDSTTNQSEFLRIKKLIKGISIRLICNGYMEEETDSKQ